jgi:hypothetical protein
VSGRAVPIVGVTLGLSTVMLFGACQAGPAPFRLPQHDRTAQGASGVATGGRIAFDGRCIWLEQDGGQANLLWPASFRAVAPPLAILGESGRAIIHEGDTVDLGVADGRGAIPGCPVRGVFLVGEISSVNGVEWPDGAPNVPTPGRPAGNPH